MSIPTITNVTRRLYRGDTTYVIYKVRLSDGRVLRIDCPFNGSLTDDRALSGSRTLAEGKVFKILQQELTTGQYHCCHGYIPKHTDRCEAA